MVFKDNGALIHQLPEVHKVCVEIEKSSQKILQITSGDLPRDPGPPISISCVVLEESIDYQEVVGLKRKIGSQPIPGAGSSYGRRSQQ